MRAPPESSRPTIGAPTFIARSMILQIFPACASDERPAEDGEVLAEDEDQSTVDGAVAGDDAVAEDRVVRTAVATGDERVELDERPGVEQQVEPLARRQLAGGVLPLDRAPVPPPSSDAARIASSRCECARGCLTRLDPLRSGVFAQGQWPSYPRRTPISGSSPATIPDIHRIR